MAAHRMHYYGPQKVAVIDFLDNIGITYDTPVAVHTADQLRGLEHINFITIDNHPQPIPQRMWDVIVSQGAMVIHVDDQYIRERAADRVLVHHYPGEASAASVQAAD